MTCQKKHFLNFDNQTFDRLWMDSIHRHNHLFTSETATLPDITILYARENLQKNEIEKGTLLN